IRADQHVVRVLAHAPLPPDPLVQVFTLCPAGFVMQPLCIQYLLPLAWPSARLPRPPPPDAQPRTRAIARRSPEMTRSGGLRTCPSPSAPLRSCARVTRAG